MPTVWIDPFIPGATATSDTTLLCAGTSTTNFDSVRDGSYANPFRFTDFASNSATNTTANGVTIAANTDVRIKGKATSDMLTSVGDWYMSGDYIYPTTANSTNFTAMVSGSPTAYHNRWLWLTGSNIDDCYPTATTTKWSGILIRMGFDFSTYGTGNLRVLGSADTRAFFNALADCSSSFKGSASSASTFCTINMLKEGYMSTDAIGNGDWYHWFTFNNNIVSSSAGWTSETEQNGYSMVALSQSDTYERNTIRGDNCTFDWSRLFIANRSQRMYLYFEPRKANVTHKLGGFAGHEFAYYDQKCRLQQDGNLEVGLMSGDVTQLGADTSGATASCALYISDQYSLRLSQSPNGNNRIKIGSMFINTSGILGEQLGFICRNTGATNIEFLNGSSYYSRLSSATTSGLNSNRNDYADVTHIYPSTLYHAGSSGIWLSNISASTAATRNPRVGLGTGTATVARPFQGSIYLAAANWWQTPAIFQQTMYDKIPIKSVGKLTCGGSNYKTTTNTIACLTGISLGETITVFPPNVGCETNDYDDKPLLILPDTGGSATSSALAYNETVDGNEVVVIQNGGATGAFAYGMEVQVPTDYDPDSSDATKNQIRLKVILSKTTNASYNPVVFVYYRSNDSVVGDQFSNTTSTDQTAPSAQTFNISAPASGDKIINSVLVYVRFDASKTVTSEKLYIHDCYVETY